jgi:hypothetical protein
MGVDVKWVERTFEPPPMSRLTAATVPAANVWGERRPGFYVVDATGNAGAIAANRLAAAGAEPSWITAPLTANGFQYAAGSIVVPYAKNVEPVVAQIAKELGLRVDGVRGRAPAGMRPIARARVALYKPWVENIDEGWTRWLLEKYEFRVASIADADIRASNLRARFDVIILPSAARDRLVGGHPTNAVPAEYAGGLGTAGVEALQAFVQAGGTLICLDQSGALAIEAFKLPVRDIAREAGDKFFCPGSILRLDLDPAQPINYGMPSRTAAFFASSAAYEAAVAPNDTEARVQAIARYGTKDLLLSGWLEGEQVIAGRPAIVEAVVGAGRVVLFGFRVQHRGQTHATFRLLFNAIFAASPAKP